MDCVAEQPNWAEFERAGWESHVGPYDSFFRPICEQIAPSMLDAVGAAEGVRLLDLCCGPGYLAGLAAARGAQATGIDIAENMAELAARTYPHVPFQSGDATDLPWAEASFDAVVCNFGIHHLSDQPAALKEIRRVLDSGGRFALSTWDEDRSGLGIVADAIYGVDLDIPTEIPTPPEVPDYGLIDEAAPLLAAAGLTLTAIRTIAFDHTYPNPGALWTGWLAAAIRTGPLFEAQSADVRGQARRRYDEAISERTNPDGSVTIPIAVFVAVGHRHDGG